MYVTNPSDVIEKCKEHPYVLDGFFDKSGTRGVAVWVDDQLHFVLAKDREPFNEFGQQLGRTEPNAICFDLRKLLNVLEIPDSKVVYDVRTLYGGEPSLFRTMRTVFGEDRSTEILRIDQVITAHIRACKTAKVDLNRHSLLNLIPGKHLQKMFSLRAKASLALMEKLTTAHLVDYVEDVYPITRAFYRIERNGIHVDVKSVQKSLDNKEISPHIRNFLQGMMSETVHEPFVYSKFNAIRGKTGRFKVESGFSSMGIPHGEPRKAITSRFPGGKIYAFDFNAIDYRCIVSSVEDESFKLIYESADDFHSKTASFLFGTEITDLRRNIVKYLTYIMIYGASEQTAAEKTGLSLEKVREVMAVLNKRMEPITKLRERICREARAAGYVTLPHGKTIPISHSDHDGKIMGLYAQGFSSYVFERALLSVERMTKNWKSRIMFPVHDELVLDVHPDDFSRVEQLTDLMERSVIGHRFKVKVKKGSSYGEATD